jgi:hypothetical protein
MMYQTILHFFPQFSQSLSKIEDPRARKSTYPIESIVMAALLLFLFKEGTRHDFNTLSKNKNFKHKILRIFGVKVSHMDSVERVFRLLKPEILSQVKKDLVHILLAKKVFHSTRHFGEYFQVVIDATGVESYSYKHCASCTHKTSSSANFTLSVENLEALAQEGIPFSVIRRLQEIGDLKIKSKKVFCLKLEEVLSSDEVEKWRALILELTGKTSWFHNVLEAKLVTSQGFAISLETQWIENERSDYHKQACESKAFILLSQKIKKEYPQLKILIVADGLYPQQTFFKTCKNNVWKWIVTFKDGNLPSIWKQVYALETVGQGYFKKRSEIKKKQDFFYLTKLDYKDFRVQFVECKETIFQKGKPEKTTRFVYLTDFLITQQNVEKIVRIGRLRQGIEDSFNTQKNRGYKLKHKLSRVSCNALKNW